MNTSVEPQHITSRREAYQMVRAAQKAGKRVGVVMTMGALHPGHLSLVQQCRSECDLTFVTIFVNPTQFLPGEDFQKYPRQLKQDIALLQSVGTDVVFAPTTEEMYPAGASTVVQPPRVGESLEGEHRPGHYDGVCTIVCKLFQILPADRAYFGSKDYQQYLVIKHMAKDLNIPVDVIACPIVRDDDGLALSSRNRYLRPAERKQALSLSQGLRLAAEHVEGLSGDANGDDRDAAKLTDRVRKELTDAGVEKIDYVAIVNPDDLSPVADLAEPSIALIAAHVGTTRLIDNRRLRPRKLSDGEGA